MAEQMIRYIELYPATITPLPPGVPPGMKYKIVVTDRYLTVAWLAGGVHRLDIELEPGDIGPDVTWEGGTVKGYEIAQRGACGTCGGGTKMLGWDPWPEVRYVEEPRKQQALVQRTGAHRKMTGLIPPRYSRR